MTIDIQTLFNETLPETIERNKAKAQSMNAKIQVSVKGEGGGDWFLDCKSDPPTCTPGIGVDPECSLTISAEHFQQLVDDPKGKAMPFYFTGKIKIGGSTTKALACASKLSALIK